MSIQPILTAEERLAALNESVKELEAKRLKALIYGESGVGKTVEAQALAQMFTPLDKEILYIDTGEGWVSLENHPQLKKRTKRMVYTGLSQIETMVEVMQAGVPGWNNYGTIIFDEFSTSADNFLHVVLDTNNVKKLTEAPEFKHWGILSRNIKDTIRKLLELKETHHLLFIAHERLREDTITKRKQVRPDFMDSVERAIKRDMHVIGRMTAEVTNQTGAPIYSRQIQVHPTTLVVGKTRVGGLDIKVNPETFNTRLKQWMDAGGQLVDETEVVELESEKKIAQSLATQSDEFTGYEVGDSVE